MRGHGNIFFRGFREDRTPKMWPCSFRTSLRLIACTRLVEWRAVHVRSAIQLFFSLLRDTLVVHRFEEIIGGRPYLIEVASLSPDRWRAQIVKIPGVPTALMPFYGRTPDEAAQHLSQWLTRAYEHAKG
jgi:hypothetical protein